MYPAIGAQQLHITLAFCAKTKVVSYYDMCHMQLQTQYLGNKLLRCYLAAACMKWIDGNKVQTRRLVCISCP